MYSVKEVAKVLKMSEHTVRYYADCELIPTLVRDDNNKRLFDQESLNWLIGIKYLKSCGMPIKEIKNYVLLCLEGDSTIQQRYDMFLNLKSLAYNQLNEAQNRVRFLENKLKHYELLINERIPDDTAPNKW